MKDNLVSILIRTKNEEHDINQTLSVLFTQTYKNFEVIIVDSGSTDRTLKIAKKYPVTIYEIKPEDFTWGYALNYGFQRANGTYIVNLSAHALPLSNDWLSILIANFDNEKIAAVMCHALPRPDCNPFDRRGLLKKFNIERQEIKEGPPFLFGNTSCAVRKTAWETVNYDESLSYCEDHDWLGKIRKLGYKAVYEPGAKVYHSHNETLKQIYRRHYQEAMASKTLNMRNYSISGIMYDLVAGSVYDMFYVLYKGDHLKWFFIAPLRRCAINLARLKTLKSP